MSGQRRLTRLSLPDQVAERLREMIVLGALPEASKLPLADLARELEVSQTPLREALKILAAEKLVELLPNRGARVSAYTPQDARHLFQVLAGLEGLSAELAAERMSRNDLASLEAMHADMRASFDRREKEPYFELNSAIHERLVHLSGNPVLGDIHGKLSVRAKRGRYIAIMDLARWIEAMEEHESLMRALRAADGAAAAAAWRLHLTHTGEATVRALEAAAREKPEERRAS